MDSTAKNSAPFDTEFDRVREAVPELYPHLSVPRICTATITCVLSKRSIDLTTLFSSQSGDIQIRTTKSSRGHEYRPFSNSITMVMDAKKTIKVFTNGKLHITGCRTIQHAHELVERLIAHMQWHEAAIVETKLLTLNTSMALIPKSIVNLHKLSVLFPRHSIKVTARYTPDIYQGVVLKVSHEPTHRILTILCFYTGSFIVSGIQHPSELEYALRVLGDTMKTILPEVVKSSSISS
jgi:TATA-box binding protein (TBP) (component of TFIID and TFIIIB)